MKQKCSRERDFKVSKWMLNTETLMVSEHQSYWFYFRIRFVINKLNLWILKWITWTMLSKKLHFLIKYWKANRSFVQLLTLYNQFKALMSCEARYGSFTYVDSWIRIGQLVKLWLLHSLPILKIGATISSCVFWSKGQCKANLKTIICTFVWEGSLWTCVAWLKCFYFINILFLLYCYT